MSGIRSLGSGSPAPSFDAAAADGAAETSAADGVSAGAMVEAGAPVRGPAAPPPASGGGRMAVLASLAASAAAPPDPAQIEADVDAIRAAMSGLGTDEDAIYAILESRTPEEREAIEARFAEKHAGAGKTLGHALHDEMSGGDLKRALDALGEDRGGFAQRGEILRDAGKGGGLGRTVRQLLTWYNFGIGGKSDAEDGLPRLTGSEIRRDMLPHLQKGDVILCGNNGGVSHALVYVGDGKVVHSMATEKTMRGHSGRIVDTLRAPVDIAAEALGMKERKQGVIEENVADFFDRFERDSYVVMRSPALDEAGLEQGLEHIQGLVGKDYDWDFAPANDSYYCTEVVGEFLRSALGDNAPRIGGTAQHISHLLHREAIVDPLDVLRSPDLKPVLHNDAVLGAHKEDLERPRDV